MGTSAKRELRGSVSREGKARSGVGWPGVQGKKLWNKPILCTLRRAVRTVRGAATFKTHSQLSIRVTY